MRPNKPAVRAAAYAAVCAALAIAGCDLAQSGTQPTDGGVPPIDASGDTVDGSGDGDVGDGAAPDSDSSVPFSPTSISGLEIWLRADMGLLVDGGAVVGWLDQSGKGDPGRNASPGGPFAAPSLVDGGVGPAPFFGPSQGLRTGRWDAGLSDPITTITVTTRATNFGLQPAFLFDSIDPQNHGVAILSDDFVWQVAGKTGAKASAVSPMVVIAAFNGTSSFVLRNSNTKGDGGIADPGTYKPGPGFVIGNSGATGYPLGGTVAEFVVYSRVLTDNEIASLNTYAAKRYGIVIQ